MVLRTKKLAAYTVTSTSSAATSRLPYAADLYEQRSLRLKYEPASEPLHISLRTKVAVEMFLQTKKLAAEVLAELRGRNLL